MTRLEAALLDIVEHLERERVPHMVIGGFANLHWGRPRLTEDLDLKIALPESSWPAFIAGLAGRFRVLTEDPLAFVDQTRVIPIRTRGDVRVDLVVAELPYESEAIERAEEVMVADRSVRICTAEDLILHKILSDRPRDRDDVRGIVARRGTVLDRSYLDPRVRELAVGLENAEIETFYRTCLGEAGLDVNA